MKRSKKLRPFLGIDGEGCGQDGAGCQHYMLMRAGEYELFTGKPLSAIDCMEFILSLPAEPLLVGFCIGYDVTQILRGLPAERFHNESMDDETGEIRIGTGIFDDRDSEHFSRYTYWKNYAIDYVPNNYLRVCRLADLRLPSGKVMRQKVKGSARTIYETYGFFRRSFLDTLKIFGVVGDHRRMLERMKASRADFNEITPTVRDYCKLECDLLAEFMTKFRDFCHDHDLRPNTWNGAGKLAGYLHRIHRTPKRTVVERRTGKRFRAFCGRAFYGARFEIIRVGEIPGPIYEYDIKSAYPAAMDELPCIRHGRWWRAAPFDLVDATRRGVPFIARVEFTHPDDATICGLPVRRSDGKLTWPRIGRGTYWSCELIAAQKVGAKIMLHDGYRYERRCSCNPFHWIGPLYELRRRLDEHASGAPIKAALNALYGKLAQRRFGIGKSYNLPWSSLITARVRARLLDAVAAHRDDVVSFASDAICSLKPLPIRYGDDLGQWSQEGIHSRMFIVQPGIYWTGDVHKTRGVSASLFMPHIAKFERAWRTYAAAGRDLPPPVVRVPLKLFIGLRYAVSQDHPELAGRWLIEDDGRGRAFSFLWQNKRAPGGEWAGRTLITRPLAGALNAENVGYGDDGELVNMLDMNLLQLDDQPDHLDLSPIRGA